MVAPCQQHGLLAHFHYGLPFPDNCHNDQICEISDSNEP